MGSSNGKQHESIGDKVKHPMRELKEKLHGVHLEDAKIHLIHQKCVEPSRCGKRPLTAV